MNNINDKIITTKRLADIPTGKSGYIVKVLGHGAFRKRITEMGFVKGKQVKVIKNAPLQDPVEYEIMDYQVSLRRNEAKMIEVVSTLDEYEEGDTGYFGTLEIEQIASIVSEKGSTINVALVGNPNCGKTTLFNYASGSHERVGNYGGVTVDAKEAVMKKFDRVFNIVDLPGTYSITEYSPEELYVRTHIQEKQPDVVVNVIDASNLERNLFLTTQLIDMNIKVVIALNMYDELSSKGAKLDYQALGKMLGIPIVPTIAKKGEGIDDLLKAIIDVYEEKSETSRHIHINYGVEIESAIQKIQSVLKKDPIVTSEYSSRYAAIKLLEGDKTTTKFIESVIPKEKLSSILKDEVRKLEEEYKEKAETIITDAKYGFISGALKETFTPGFEERRKQTDNIDFYLTHKLFGFPIFIFLMWLMFQSTFTLGKIPMDLIDSGVSSLGAFIKNVLAEGPLRDLLVDGVIGGVGGVVVFLPNILILFFFISLMEDTGYMARAAFIMDRLMHKIGLHGKSFIPLLMGFGCNVPAVMATRTLDNKKDRILTMIITPFMSCSARLPVYVLIISATFTKNQGLVLFTIYTVGIIIAVIVALVMKRFAFAKQEVPFVMELPPYRVPTLRNTSMHMWHKSVQYLRKMGNVILVASVLIWALGYFPRDVKYSKDFEKEIQTIQTSKTFTAEEKSEKVSVLELAKESERQQQSYIGQAGRFIEPVIQPLGFDWKIGVSIIAGLMAKEIVVSTMGVLYQADIKADENSSTLQEKLKQQVHETGPYKGQKVFSPQTAFALMFFVLIYFPCVAVIAAVRKESNWKWAVFIMSYTTIIAYIIALATNQIGRLFF